MRHTGKGRQRSKPHGRSGRRRQQRRQVRTGGTQIQNCRGLAVETWANQVSPKGRSHPVAKAGAAQQKHRRRGTPERRGPETAGAETAPARTYREGPRVCQIPRSIAVSIQKPSPRPGGRGATGDQGGRLHKEGRRLRTPRHPAASPAPHPWPAAAPIVAGPRRRRW